jgi:hypothetical protein
MMIYFRPLVLITLLYIHNLGGKGDHTCWIEIRKNTEQGAISNAQMTDRYWYVSYASLNIHPQQYFIHS